MSEDILFEMFRGDDYSLRVEIKDSLDNAVDITGWEFAATMKLSTEMTDAQAGVQVDIPPASGIEAESGVLYIELPHEQTKDLFPTDYFFDLQRKTDNRISTVFIGKARIKADVTQRV